jgi:hypothetical protein
MREDDECQGSLFGGEGLAPSRRTPPAGPAEGPRDETAAPRRVGDTPRQETAAPPRKIETPRGETAAPPREIAAPSGEIAASPREVEAPGREIEAPREFVALDEGAEAIRVSRAPLAGPTLDDAVSRAWEGILAGLPATCPVCHGEIEPAHRGGHCGTCDITLD